MRRARLAARLAVLAALAGAATAAHRLPAGVSQEPSSEAQESELDKFLRLAQSGSAVVRPQAAQKLVELGAPAAERLKQQLGASANALAELGSEITEVLADFGDAELRAALWAALDDPDFPWRPAAARGLARKPERGEEARFVAALDDPIATVREPAVSAVERLAHRDALPKVRALLMDPDDRVRRVAAGAAFRAGDRCAVAWIVEDLKRDDAWFELQTGKLARYQALKLLEQGLDGHLRRNFGFKAEKTWDDPVNAEAVAKIEQFLKTACPEVPELPPVARAAPPTAGDVIGLEIRSCRKGEFFLRWNADDVLFVGTGNAVRVELPAGTVARLHAAAVERIAELGDQRLWGAPGCDTEQLVFRAAPDARSTSYRVSKGQEFVPGIRPASLGRLEALLIETLPEDGDDPRSNDLRARVSDALRAVGGDLPTE